MNELNTMKSERKSKAGFRMEAKQKSERRDMQILLLLYKCIY